MTINSQDTVSKWGRHCKGLSNRVSTSNIDLTLCKRRSACRDLTFNQDKALRRSEGFHARCHAAQTRTRRLEPSQICLFIATLRFKFFPNLETASSSYVHGNLSVKNDVESQSSDPRICFTLKPQGLHLEVLLWNVTSFHPCERQNFLWSAAQWEMPYESFLKLPVTHHVNIRVLQPQFNMCYAVQTQ